MRAGRVWFRLAAGLLAFTPALAACSGGRGWIWDG
jgi:hypothetical protein